MRLSQPTQQPLKISEVLRTLKIFIRYDASHTSAEPILKVVVTKTTLRLHLFFHGTFLRFSDLTPSEAAAGRSSKAFAFVLSVSYLSPSIRLSAGSCRKLQGFCFTFLQGLLLVKSFGCRWLSYSRCSGDRLHGDCRDKLHTGNFQGQLVKNFLR